MTKLVNGLGTQKITKLLIKQIIPATIEILVMLLKIVSLINIILNDNFSI